MKRIITVILLATQLSSCGHKSAPVTDMLFIDSLLSQYSESEVQKTNRLNLVFWKNKLDKDPHGFVELQQYASALYERFNLYGSIDDLLASDSILYDLNNKFKGKDAGIVRTLAAHSITQHKFVEAGNYVQQAMNLGSEKYVSELLNFDAAFELGRGLAAKDILSRIKHSNEYGYFFRLSKQLHLEGELDSAIIAMKKATTLTGGNISQQQTAISNTADLYMHAADAKNANELYMQSLKLDASDLHSLMGIGWISLVHDKKDSLAEKIFRFVGMKTKSPDIILKLMQVAEQRGDSAGVRKYSTEFISIVTDSLYGNMYNKYLVDLYTNISGEPGKAVLIAEKELRNRSTSQTHSWYAWSLFKAGRKEDAFKEYVKHVSGKPLEALELYYMGKMMKDMGKGYNAGQYFKAAYKNRYDLSPSKQLELEHLLNN